MDFLLTIIILAVFTLLIPVAFLLLIRNVLGKEQRLPYIKKNWFLTKAETEFFRILEQAIDNKYYIFPQVHISELLLVKDAGENYYKYRNKIDRKSVDYAIIDKNCLTPVMAIELDDGSHNYSDRTERDNFVEKAFKEAGLPLLRIDFRKSYNVQELSSLIYNIIHNPSIVICSEKSSNVVP